MTNTVVKRPTLDAFIEAFLAGLVLRGKKLIWIRSPKAPEEQERMYALYQYLHAQCEACRDASRNNDTWQLLIAVRNLLKPSPIGSFENFRHILMQKSVWLTSYDRGAGHYFKIDISLEYAEDIVQQTPKFVRDVSDACVAVYLK